MFLKFLKSFAILLLINCLNSVTCESEDIPQVYIDNDEFKGLIIGKRFQEADVEYIGFRGIAYAKPPINELRFRVSTKRSSEFKLGLIIIKKGGRNL